MKNGVFPTILLAIVAIIYGIYNGPLIVEVSSINFSDAIATYYSVSDSLIPPLIRSVLFASCAAVAIVTVALGTSLILQQISTKHNKVLLLSSLLLPILLGNSSTAFLWKITLFDQSLPFSSVQAKFIFLNLIQFWQYGTFFIYLFWINGLAISEHRWAYCTSARLTEFEKTKDVILPAQKNLFILLTIITYIFSYYEEAKISFIFKASRGSNTEMINQWINRKYNELSTMNPEQAFSLISVSSFFVFILGLVSLLVLVFILNKCYLMFIQSRLTSTVELNFAKNRHVASVLVFSLSIFCVLPIVIAFFKQGTNIHFVDTSLIKPLYLSSLAALFVTFISVYLNTHIRIGYKRAMANLNFTSLIVIVCILLLAIIPPIVLLIEGFRWLKAIGYSSSFMLYAAWIVGHILLTFPLICSFIIVTHFKTPTSFISYINSHKFRLIEKQRDLFFTPFRIDYILTFLIAFNLIWNESTINTILSDLIPSFISKLNQTISGKAADYSIGMNYLLVSILVSVLCISLWNYVMYRQRGSKMTSK